MSIRRRDFLRGAGAFIVTAKLAGCGDNNKGTPDAAGDDRPPTGTFVFPQGLASGDPRTASVVLWTRVVHASPSGQPIEVRVEVFKGESTDGAPVVDQMVQATIASDHTVRVLVQSLAADSTYIYRFTAGRDSISGRTRTAPGENTDAQVNIGWVSCQDYGAGHFTAYQQMLEDDRARPAADRIHFVMHLGDAIYETLSEGFSAAIDANFQPIQLRNNDGSPRRVGSFPDGGRTGSTVFANTLADYRHLYKTFFSDPDFQAARARWPFIHVWDDHEFTNDAWQSMSNYLENATVDEPMQRRRVAASQAWFEYTPAQLTGSAGPAGVAQDAKDFAAPAMVTDAPFITPNADNFVAEANNTAAIGAITIYRSLRWGKHVEIVMTDERSYRSDHAVPEELAGLVPQLFFDPRNFLPLDVVNILDQGATANGGNPPATIGGVPNPRRTAPVGTMLGKQQKAWWKSTMQTSNATWKIWGNQVPFMRIFVEGSSTGLGFDRVLDGDGWDGYPTERKELMQFLATNSIKNVVLLTGDFHSHFAGVLVDDPDGGAPVPVANELIAAGIASNSLFSFYESATRALPASLRALVTLGPTFVENLNMLIQFGTVSAAVIAQGGSVAAAKAQTDNMNAHIKYVDTNAQGYGYAKVTGAQIEATLVTINRPISLPSPGIPGQRRTATVTIPKDNPGGMTAPVLTGTKPFPL